MAFQVSPGVLVTEKDLTNVIPAVSTSIGGAVIVAEKGPIDEVTAISSETDLLSVFGKPLALTYEYWFTAANFLQYGNALKVVRPALAGMKNAGVSGTAVLIKNTTDYTDNYATGQGAVGSWAARDAGTLGNNLKVSMCTNATAFGGDQMGGNVVNDASAAIGDTTITIDDGSLLQVGDVLEFGSTADYTAVPSGHYYKVTGISTHVLTIARFNTGTGKTETGGLRHAVVDNAKVTRRWEYYWNFSNAPTSTDDAVAAGGSLDELHIVVLDEDGSLTGTAGHILETFEGLSQASDGKNSQGGTNYYVDVLYNQSEYIYWMDHEATLANAGSAKAGQTFDNQGANAFTVYSNSLTGGLDGTAAHVPTNAELSLGFDRLGDAETEDVDLLITGPSHTSADATGDTKATKVIDIADGRKDCVAFISPARADVVNVTDPIAQTINVKGFADGLPSSSYAVIDSGYKYQFDKYNDVYRWVPLNGDIAGLCARTDTIADPWFSPGGFSRGQIRGAVKLAFNPIQIQRDDLYKARVNPVVTFPGQ